VFLTRNGHVQGARLRLAKLRPGRSRWARLAGRHESTASGRARVRHLHVQSGARLAADARSDVLTSASIPLRRCSRDEGLFRGESRRTSMAAILQQSHPKARRSGRGSFTSAGADHRAVSPEGAGRPLDSAHELAIALKPSRAPRALGVRPLRGNGAHASRWARRPWGPVTALVLLAIGRGRGWGVWHSQSGRRAGGGADHVAGILPSELLGRRLQDFLADG